MLKAGLVGAGHLGKIHLRLLNQSDKYELIGFHDKDVENGKKLEAEFGYKYFENFDELLNQVEKQNHLIKNIHVMTACLVSVEIVLAKKIYVIISRHVQELVSQRLIHGLNLC